jgi:hypothetical protein
VDKALADVQEHDKAQAQVQGTMTVSAATIG